MYHQRLVETACKRVDEHERIVQSEAPHVVVAVQGTAAITEVLIGTQQTAVGPIDILDDKLVTTVIKLIHDSISIPCIELPYALPMLLGNRSQRVIHCKLEEQIRQF
jgi:hypothetical protein